VLAVIGLGVAAATATVVVQPAAPAVASSASDRALEALAAQLRQADPAARLRAVGAIVDFAANPSSPDHDERFAALVRRLERPLATKPDQFRKLFLEMWAQVPNWKGSDPMWIRKPEPPWVPPPVVKGQPRPKRPPPHDPETLDWVAALNDVDLTLPGLFALEAPDYQKPPPGAKKPPPVVVKQKPGEPAPPPPPAPVPPTPEEVATSRAEALETVALLRGIAKTRRLDAVEPLFKKAFTDEGVFRDECGRQIRAMESYAVPALVRLTAAKGPAKMRRYATYQLDRMDRAQPKKAVTSAPDERTRAEILKAYGEVRALNAVEAVLDQVDAASRRVRREARTAWLRYVTGPAPPPAPRRKRKLPGGRTEVEEKPDYLTYREIATLVIQKRAAEVLGEEIDPKLTAAQLTDKLFSHYDRVRAAGWDAQLAQAKEREAAGDWQGAIDLYEAVLAHEPSESRRPQMVHAYVARADELAKAKRRTEAARLYHQAVNLDPTGPEATHAAARAALLDAMAAIERGEPATDLLERALALDPSLPEAGEALAKARAAHGRTRVARTAASAGVGAAALVGLWLLWRRAARPRRRREGDGEAAT
jgi:tetratricopeptide (TPR) repeat protein